MPDNVGYTPGVGATIAADEVPAGSGVLYQRMKLAVGVDGAGTDVSEQNPIPVVDETIPLLRRIVRLLEPSATQDAQQRQRVTVDAFTAGTALPTVTAVGTVTTVTTVANQTTLAGMDREMYINIARNTYANAIRAKLT